MGNNAANVSTGKPMVTGAVFTAPLGTALPTDAATPLSSDFECLGHVSEDGLANANELDISEIKAWGGLTVYRSLNGLSDNFTLKLIESENVEVLKRVYGENNVTVDDQTGVTKITVKADDPEERVWVFEIALRGNKKKRIVIADGAVTSREEITYNDSDPIAYGITVSAYPNSDGATHDEYLAAQ